MGGQAKDKMSKNKEAGVRWGRSFEPAWSEKLHLYLFPSLRMKGGVSTTNIKAKGASQTSEAQRRHFLSDTPQFLSSTI